MKPDRDGRLGEPRPGGGSLDHGEPRIPLFSQDWWLEAVAPGRWGVATVEDQGRLLARWPYVVKKRFGMTLLTMPPLTPRLGPQLYPSRSNRFLRASEEQGLLGCLADKLPDSDYFAQSFYPETEDWLPLYWRGYKQTTRYTYILENVGEIEYGFDFFRDNIKREIKKAEKQVFVEDGDNVDDFVAVFKMTFNRQNLDIPFEKRLIDRIDQACVKHGCRKILLARDVRGKVHAGLYLVWDDSTAYYLMGGADPVVRTSGASSLLLWKAIQAASGVARRFDFEGSMIQPIEHFFRAFGGVRTPYSLITRAGRMMRVGLALRDILDVCRGR